MGGLPKYSRVPNDTDPLAKSNRLSIDSEHETNTTTGAGTSSLLPSHNVTYVYDPSWPIKGARQEVLGPLGSNVQETLAIVREAFSELGEYEDARITFRAPIGKENAYIGVMNGVWHELVQRKPWCVRVHVKDGPGDDMARCKREWLTAVIFVGIIIGAVALFIYLVSRK